MKATTSLDQHGEVFFDLWGNHHPSKKFCTKARFAKEDSDGQQ